MPLNMHTFVTLSFWLLYACCSKIPHNCQDLTQAETMALQGEAFCPEINNECLSAMQFKSDLKHNCFAKIPEEVLLQMDPEIIPLVVNEVMKFISFASEASCSLVTDWSEFNSEILSFIDVPCWRGINPKSLSNLDAEQISVLGSRGINLIAEMNDVSLAHIPATAWNGLTRTQFQQMRPINELTKVRNSNARRFGLRMLVDTHICRTLKRIHSQLDSQELFEEFCLPFFELYPSRYTVGQIIVLVFTLVVSILGSSIMSLVFIKRCIARKNFDEEKDEKQSENIVEVDEEKEFESKTVLEKKTTKEYESDSEISSISLENKDRYNSATPVDSVMDREIVDSLLSDDEPPAESGEVGIVQKNQLEKENEDIPFQESLEKPELSRSFEERISTPNDNMEEKKIDIEIEKKKKRRAKSKESKKKSASKAGKSQKTKVSE